MRSDRVVRHSPRIVLDRSLSLLSCRTNVDQLLVEHLLDRRGDFLRRGGSFRHRFNLGSVVHLGHRRKRNEQQQQQSNLLVNVVE